MESGRGRRGASLGTVLLILVVMTGLAACVATLSAHHLRFTVQASNANRARNLAESAVALGIDRVLADPTFGKLRRASDRLYVTLDGCPQGTGWLSFDASSPTASTNNFDSDSSVPGYRNSLVPQDSVQLVGVGTCCGVTRRVEVILHVPRYPYVIACSGRFESNGGLLVGGLNSEAALSGGVDPAALGPGHVANNFEGSRALVLGPDTRIMGDVRSAGEVAYDPERTEIDGQVVPFGERTGLPDLNVEDYDPLLQGRVGVQTLPGSACNLRLEGWARRSGDLYLRDGLTLDGGVLYVDGDLYLGGGVRGTGAILVTGSTDITGGASLVSDNRVCLLSGGDVRLQGEGRYSSSFNGLVYTEGSFVASDLTLVGTFISNSQDPQDSVAIDRATLAHTGESTEVSFPVGGSSFGVRSTKDGYRSEVYPLKYPPSWVGRKVDLSKMLNIVDSQNNLASTSKLAGAGVAVMTAKPLKNPLAGNGAAGVPVRFYLYDPEGNLVLDGGSLQEYEQALASAGLGTPSKWEFCSLNAEQIEKTSQANLFQLDLNRFVQISERASILLHRDRGGFR